MPHVLWLYMASAGPERANLGPKQEKSIGLESGTLPAGRAQPRRAWHHAQQQAKPIWNLEKKYVSAFLRDPSAAILLLVPTVTMPHTAW